MRRKRGRRWMEEEKMYEEKGKKRMRRWKKNEERE